MGNIQILGAGISKIMGFILLIIGNVFIKGGLRFERYILKPFFKVEGPLYKLWWKNHSQAMQKRLNAAHGTQIAMA